MKRFFLLLAAVFGVGMLGAAERKKLRTNPFLEQPSYGTYDTEAGKGERAVAPWEEERAAYVRERLAKWDAKQAEEKAAREARKKEHKSVKKIKDSAVYEQVGYQRDEMSRLAARCSETAHRVNEADDRAAQVKRDAQERNRAVVKLQRAVHPWWAWVDFVSGCCGCEEPKEEEDDAVQ